MGFWWQTIVLGAYTHGRRMRVMEGACWTLQMHYVHISHALCYCYCHCYVFYGRNAIQKREKVRGGWYCEFSWMHGETRPCGAILLSFVSRSGIVRIKLKVFGLDELQT